MNNLQPLFIREEVLRAVRNFFEEKKFHEVITPVLNKALPLEPNIFAFSTEWTTSSGKKELYLATSPESGLKKMLAEGIGNCFAIGKSFRNLEGTGTLHNPEFLMLEWYREDADYKEIMNDVKELLLYVKKRIDIYLHQHTSSELEYDNKAISLGKTWETVSLVELFEKYAALQIKDIINDDVLFKKASEKGYNVKNTTWGQVFDQIFVNEIEPQLPLSPFFLTDFPARTSPLCAINKSKPYLAERFEFYLFGIELGNGNTENTDAQYVRDLFIKEKKSRDEQKLTTPPIDEEFLDALDTMSHKKYAGIGLGLDRLAMIMANYPDIYFQ